MNETLRKLLSNPKTEILGLTLACEKNVHPDDIIDVVCNTGWEVVQDDFHARFIGYSKRFMKYSFNIYYVHKNDEHCEFIIFHITRPGVLGNEGSDFRYIYYPTLNAHTQQIVTRITFFRNFLKEVIEKTGIPSSYWSKNSNIKDKD